MPTFQVPQFIDIEDKIIGPLTLRQFIYLAVAGGLIFLLNFILEFWLWFLVSIVIAVFGLACAFVKINNQPLPRIVKNYFKYLISPRLYTWQKPITKKELVKKIEPVVQKEEKKKKRLTVEELEELAKKLQ